MESQARNSVVDTYTNYQVWELGGKQLRYVETRHCQHDFRQEMPSKSAMIDSLKEQTQKLGGNALVVDSCDYADTATCDVEMLCKGFAYHIDYQ